MTEVIWKCWAPMKCKFAMWLIIRERIWTADRLARKGLPHNDKCPFCNLSPENAQHLFIGCAVVNIIWGNIMSWVNLQHLTPSSQLNLKEWWVQARSSISGKTRKRLDSLVLLVVWTVWRERNGRVFDKNFKPTNTIIEQIKQEARQWVIASAGRLTLEDV